MQCLSSPTREEVDKAHNLGQWLDIGIPSIRNLRRISRRRLVLWWLLAGSSIPLHLMYNSAVFSTLAARSYGAFLGPNDIARGPSQRWSYVYSNGQQSLDISTFEVLDNKKCIEEYSQAYVAAHKNVVIISSTEAIGNNIQIITPSNFAYYGPTQPYCWMCPTTIVYVGAQSRQNCDVNKALSDAGEWTLSSKFFFNSSYQRHHSIQSTSTGLEQLNIDYSVDYCLSERVQERCKLQFSLAILIVVMACNLIKAICMFLVLRTQESPPLVTLGDAIASFLEFPDRFATGNAVEGKSRFWFRTASVRRWLCCTIL